MSLISYTIYHGGEDRPDTVGITFKPTPSLTKAELLKLIDDLSAVVLEMEPRPCSTKF